jgi:hypothetical protein
MNGFAFRGACGRLFDLSGNRARARNSGVDLCLDEGHRNALDSGDMTSSIWRHGLRAPKATQGAQNKLSASQKSVARQKDAMKPALRQKNAAAKRLGRKTLTLYRRDGSLLWRSLSRPAICGPRT